MKLIKHILVLLLIVSTLFSAISCGKKSKNNENNNDYSGPSVCTVTVKNPLGKPISNVAVYLHHDDGSDYNVCAQPLTTDLDGKVTFSLDTEKKYSVGLGGYPTVYTAKSGATPNERYALNSENIEIVLELRSGYAPKSYDFGDYMADFTITDIDGETYNLYSILEEKRAVVLNFWYCGCNPCQNEFPALNTAYNNYKDSIEVLAINDKSAFGESEEDVRSFGAQRGLNMPLFKVDYGSGVSISRFENGGYPTTVVIDCFGMVSYVHTGGINSVSEWNSIFDHYTSADYNGVPYN